MRFLGIGNTFELGDMYLHLRGRGHDVRVLVRDAAAQDMFEGMITRTPTLDAGLAWVKAAGDDGIVLFESAEDGALQDDLRARGFHVIGGCSWGDTLESDRGFGQEIMRSVGMLTASVHEFNSFERAMEFVQDTRKRYVFKLSGAGFASWRNYVGELDDGADMLALLKLWQRSWKGEEAPRFILMDHLQGVEVGVGAYFNGEQFLTPVCLDWEHKRFFPGDIGELTGEMGTLVTYRGAEKIFERTLGRMAPLLKEHHYVGYLNLNTIADARGIWPLEFTCRFGYPGYSILDALHVDGWDTIFHRMLFEKGHTSFQTHEGYAVGVVLTVPPFPYSQGYEEIGKGAPISFRGQLSDGEKKHLHFGEVTTRDGQLVTSGMVGYIMVATGRGAAVTEAQRNAYALTHKVLVPNVRYRRDIGEKFIQQDEALLRSWGLL